jgi:multiple sugar transport system ATP-binding protein
MAALNVRGVHKQFGQVQVLKGIDLTVENGEFAVLLGPSGCGKSTLLNVIAGLERPSAGTVEIGDRVVNDIPPKDRDIAMVFQSYALYPTMTVKENITFGMESRGVPKAIQAEALARVAGLLQIEHLLKRKPGQLSGGQRQRVAMGRALVRDPLLFLFDEPLSNLDAKLRVEMRMEIKKLHQKVGKTTVYVTHDQVEAMTLASRIAVMHQGRVQQFAEPREVYDRPANMFVAGFMGSPAMNFIPAEMVSEGGKPALSVKTANGKTATLALYGDAAARVRDGNVILGIRPEHLSRFDPQAASQKPGLASVSAPVELVEPTGAETIAVMRLGDIEIVGRFDPDEAPRMGEEIKLGVDMAKACLFDPATTTLI